MRLLIGLFWFVVFLCAIFIGMGIYIAATLAPGADPHGAGFAMGQKYGSQILLGALGLTFGGTLLGILPGMRKKSGDDPRGRR
jgi:hypothetical protein